MKYGKVLDSITVEQAEEIIKSQNVGVVICKTDVDDEVKDILKDVALYVNVTDEDIRRIERELNREERKARMEENMKDPVKRAAIEKIQEKFRKSVRSAKKFINENNALPGGEKPIHPENNIIRLDDKEK